MKEMLIKDGMKFNLDTSTLIAKTDWYFHNDLQRRLIYKSAKGNFFSVIENAMVKDFICTKIKDGESYNATVGSVTYDNHSLSDGRYYGDLKLKERFVNKILTEEDVRDTFEYTMLGKPYSLGSYMGTYQYKLLVPYDELFDLKEM